MGTAPSIEILQNALAKKSKVLPKMHFRYAYSVN